MNEQEKLCHQIATKIFDKTGIAIEWNDPIVILTLCNIQLIEDAVSPFLSQLENTTETLNNFNNQLDLYIKTTQQVLITTGKKEITDTINQPLKDIVTKLNQIETSVKIYQNRFDKKIMLMFSCIIVFQFFAIIIFILSR